MSRIETISVVVPLRDEAEHIPDLLADIAAQDFPGALEVLVADGGSRDGSRRLLERAAMREGSTLTVVDNPSGTVSCGLNLCVRQAHGDLIVRLDAHARYPSDYLRRCVAASEATGADNVGGTYVAEGRTPFETAVACALDSPFGGVNWSRHSGNGRRSEADTVWCGAFRPSAFVRAGLFDEQLVRDQDDEFNLRLRRNGGRIVLDPSIQARYRPRPSLPRLFRQYYEYGYWKVPVMRKHRRVLSARSLVPAGFVLSLGGLALAAPVSTRARRALIAECGLYAAAAAGFAGRAVRGRGEPVGRVPTVVRCFGAMHLGYGVGMAAGALAALRRHRSV